MRGVGHTEMLIERRERILAHCSPAARARITGHRPHITPINHEIVVDLRTGARSVKTVDPLQNPPKIKPVEAFVKKIHIPEKSFGTAYSRRRIDTRVSVFAVLDAVAISYQVTIAALTGAARSRRIAWPRMAAVKLLRDERNMSHPEIGFVLGKRDHSTSMSALKRANELLATQPEWAARYQHAVDLLLA